MKLPFKVIATVLGFLLLIGTLHRGEAQPNCVSIVHFELAAKIPLPEGSRQGKLVLRPKADQGEARTVPVAVGTPVAVELPCASEWEVAADFPNVWAARKPVMAGASGAETTTALALWPLGRIAGALKLAEKGERLPKSIVVQTLSPRSPAQRDTPQGSMDCPVNEQGKWSCPPLPATTFDLVVSAAGFIPQYRWGLAVLPDKATDLGTLVLKRGASVAGWVEVEGGAIDPACRARLTPLVGPGGSPAAAERVRSTGREVAVRKDGFFQIAGVAPGDYGLEVRQPGFAQATVQPIAVSPRSETFLRDPVVLTRPLDIELAISPPRDGHGRPWQVLVFQASGDTGGFDKEVSRRPADEQGNVRIPRQTPGRFRALIADSLDNPFGVHTFQVTGPENASQAIRLKILALRGTVKLGKEPLAATLWFGGRHGKESVELTSDREGSFQGAVPRDGWWTVDVRSASPKFETRTRVKVKTDGQQRARADIDLPGTRIYGKVLDEAGHPMPAATVMVSTDDGAAVHMDTDGTGGFEFRGMTEGLAYAAATLSSAQGEWSSDRVPLFLQEGEDAGPVELRMRRETKLSGSVRSARGPVPGAGVAVFGIRPGLMGGDLVRTEMDGTFTAHVPAPAELADVMVSAPGFGLKAFPMAVGAASSQPLEVEESSGELQILLPPSSGDPKDATTLWIFQNGLYLSKQALVQWASVHGREPVSDGEAGRKLMAVPELAPGEYRACLAAPADLVAWQASGWTAPLARCVFGTLTAGATLQLDLGTL